MNTKAEKNEQAADRFPLGNLYMTPGAMQKLPVEEALAAIGRHAAGDWGECCTADAAENEFAIDKYLRIFSVYRTAADVKFWVITEADRSVTTVLLPEEY